MGMSGFHLANNMWVLSTAASRPFLRLGTGRRVQKLSSTLLAAKVELLSISFGVESGCFVHGHSTDGVFGYRFGFFHGRAPLLVILSLCFDLVFHLDMRVNGQVFRVNRKLLFPFLLVTSSCAGLDSEALGLSELCSIMGVLLMFAMPHVL